LSCIMFLYVSMHGSMEIVHNIVIFFHSPYSFEPLQTMLPRWSSNFSMNAFLD
jgi:hypothetical protein